MLKKKILIIGNLSVKKNIVEGICKDLKLNPKVIEYVSYGDATNYNYRKLKNNNNYSDIIVGPIPHKGKYIENFSSIVTMLENNEYPNTIRAIDSNELKLTKTSIRSALLKTTNYRLGEVIC